MFLTMTDHHDYGHWTRVNHLSIYIQSIFSVLWSILKQIITLLFVNRFSSAELDAQSALNIFEPGKWLENPCSL